MRAYHLSKARTLSELPDWLFSDRERGQLGLVRSNPPNDGSQAGSTDAQQAQRRNRPENHSSKNLEPYPRGLKTTPSAIFPPISSGSDGLKKIREDRPITRI